MKKFAFIFFIAFAFNFNVKACPYQKMAEVDSKLYSNKNINTETLLRFLTLELKGSKS